MAVYKKNNRWYIDYYLSNGKRKREVVSIEGVDPSKINREDAKKALSIRKAEIAQGKFDIRHTNSKQMSFEKLAHTFLEDYSKVNKRSWKRDRTSCRALLGYFGNIRINQITPWNVDKYKSNRLKEISRLGKPISKASINREIACLKKMLSYAVAENWIPSNPLKGYRLFNEKPKKIRVVTLDEFNMVYNNSSEYIKPILNTAYNTGMRRGEILNLKWEHVNLHEGYIRVEESKNNEQRLIPLNNEMKKTLKSLNSEKENEHVFNKNGQAIICFKTAFEGAILRSGVERFTFHDLRHTFATNLVMNNVDIVTVQELLGHKSILMTKRYSHPTLEHKKRAVQLINSGVLEDTTESKILNLNNKNYRTKIHSG